MGGGRVVVGCGRVVVGRGVSGRVVVSGDGWEWGEGWWTGGSGVGDGWEWGGGSGDGWEWGGGRVGVGRGC